MRTCQEKKRSILNLAVKLKDDSAPDKNVIGDVFLKAQGIIKQPFRHETGYFLFIDLPKGKHKLTAGGKWYKEKYLIVDTAFLNPREPFVEFFLDRKDAVQKTKTL